MSKREARETPVKSRAPYPGKRSERRRSNRRIEDSVASSLRFFGSFLRQPARVGSLLPSSPTLARALVQHCPLETARVVVELGPGTGAITAPILERLGPRTLFLALELDAGHARALAEQFPRLKSYHDSAEHLETYLRRHHVRCVDCVISGLPWANMRSELQERILRPVVRCLHPEGVFVAFGYAHARWLPTTLRFRKQLRRHFAEVHTSRVIWRNLPPAFVYTCRGPRPDPGSGKP
jgi:phospholipid N-methyltransferase